jgi:hypothetical protein
MIDYDMNEERRYRMGRRRKLEGEAAWVAVARECLPSHLTWPGFCREMGWPGSVPFVSRKSDNLKLATYLKAAKSLDLDPMVFLERVVCEIDSRSKLNMEVPDGGEAA